MQFFNCSKFKKKRHHSRNSSRPVPLLSDDVLPPVSHDPGIHLTHGLAHRGRHPQVGVEAGGLLVVLDGPGHAAVEDDGQLCVCVFSDEFYVLQGDDEVAGGGGGGGGQQEDGGELERVVVQYRI